MDSSLKRRTFALLDVVVIAIALGFFTLIPGAAHDGGVPDRLVVTVGGGRPPEIHPLSPDRKIEIEGHQGKTVLQADGGALRVVSSPCPNKICMRMGDVTLSGQVLVCVPNRVSVRLAGGGEKGLDAIVR